MFSRNRLGCEIWRGLFRLFSVTWKLVIYTAVIFVRFLRYVFESNGEDVVKLSVCLFSVFDFFLGRFFCNLCSIMFKVIRFIVFVVDKYGCVEWIFFCLSEFSRIRCTLFSTFGYGQPSLKPPRHTLSILGRDMKKVFPLPGVFSTFAVLRFSDAGS